MNKMKHKWWNYQGIKPHDHCTSFLMDGGFTLSKFKYNCITSILEDRITLKIVRQIINFKSIMEF